VAVKQILLVKNQEQNFIIEDLDDYHLLIKSDEEERIRRMLDTEVVHSHLYGFY
jgi:TFIIH basal transcription factor complex TTD-A subunit